MTQAIVGVFDSFDEANRAVERLERAGIARTDIQVHGRDSSPATYDPATVADRRPEGEGVVARIEHFFSNLFGSDDHPEEIGHYHEAVRRGSALVTVEVANEAHADLVRAEINDAGAVDIDERVAQWKSSGYAGCDPSAREYTADEVAAERKAFPVVREDLAVGKREVQTGGVRVYSRATATPVSETVNLREEHAAIERRPVDRPATSADLKLHFPAAFLQLRTTGREHLL
jgi:hypothetical protein